MLNVYIAPQYDTPDRAEGGIRRVVEAMVRYLPDFGVRPVADIRLADVVNGHGVLTPYKPATPFVGSCHGLHWADYEWPNWAHEVNRMVTDNLRRSQAVTAPSRWVAQAITRGMLVNPTVIYHGVDADEWAHTLPARNYVLWNKARVDPVSNSDDMNALADRMPDMRFVSTLGRSTLNVDICGVMPLPEMRRVIQSAGVYLATARETFGVGTLEALAAGVPIVGWRYGGQAEIVVQGETGYLAEPGNYAELEGCLRQAFAERARLSANAVADARARWAWPDKIAQYAAVFQRAHADWHTPRPKVSVIVTCHNLARFLPDCLRSILAQPFPDWECLIIDDASTDETPQVADEWVRQDRRGRLRYLRTPRNLKLVGALNYGFAESRGRYVLNLDADNMLGEDALTPLAAALDDDPTLAIAFGPLDTVNDDGSNRQRNPWPGDFDWRAQMAHYNQIHSSALMRREVRERSGGYRERMWRAEDAEFWCRVTSFGFRAARVTDTPTLIYRMRPDSKSRGEGGDGDWCGGFPWRLAATAQEGVQALRRSREVPNAHLVPFGAAGDPPPGRLHWNAYHHQAPLVSVVIPVGPGHAGYVVDALDSLIAQDTHVWEAVVVNDTGDPWETVTGAPWARVIRTAGRQGPAAARSAGVQAARGQLVLFLDADDYLVPGALSQWIEEYRRGDAAYIYTDYIEVRADRTEKYVALPEYDQRQWRGQHATNILIARADLLGVGLFDPALRGWEDWDLFVKLAIAGKCGRRAAFAGFAYRFDTGTIRNTSLERKDEILPVMRERYADYYDGGKAMASCCGGDATAVLEAKRVVEGAQRLMGVWEAGPVPDIAVQTTGLTPTMVRMEFIGERTGAVAYFGGNGRQYSAGNNPHDKYVDVHHEDVEHLELTGDFRRVPLKPAPAEKPGQVELPPLSPATVTVEAVLEAAPLAMSADMPPAPAIVRAGIDSSTPAKLGRRGRARR